MTRAQRRRRDESDIVILDLIRLVSTEPYDEERAAGVLRAKRYHVGALWRARARVLRTLNHTPSRVAERAAGTLHEVLTGVAGSRVPSGT